MVEWTNQHGCGGDEDSDPHKLNCNVVLQYMCQRGDESNNGKCVSQFVCKSYGLLLANLQRDTIRNGVQRTIQGHTPPPNQPNAANDESRRNGAQVNRGLHESFDWYDACYSRPRNNGWYLVGL